MRTPRLIRRVTKRLQSAVHTPRLPGHADLPAMMNQLMREIDPPVLRDNPHQIPLHLFRSRLPGQFQSPRDTHNMRINNNSRRNLKPGPEHNIPRLPRHPRQPENLLHRLRNLPPKLLHHNPRRPLNRLRLVSKKSRSPNQLLQFRQRSRSHSLRSRKRLEQRRSHQIHSNIRTLSRQNRRHSQLPRTPMMQRTNHSRISLPQSIQNRRNPRRIERTLRPRTLHSSTLHRSSLRSCPNLARHSYPSRSSISIAGTRTQLKIGVSASVYMLISVSRSCCTRSRKSSGKLVSNATTNS